MSDTKETTEKTGSGRKPLQLKRTVETGHVQQKFSQGRSKSVVVEKKRKRTVLTMPSKDEGAATEAAPPTAPTHTPKASPDARPTRKRGAKAAAPQKSQVKNPGGLSDSEMSARAQALAAARLRAVEDEKRNREDQERRAAEAAEREAREKAEADAEKKRLADEAIRKATDQVIVEQKKPEPKKAPEPEPEPVAAAQPAARGPARSDEPRTTKRVLEQPLGMTAPVIVTRTDRAAPKPPAPRGVDVFLRRGW
ncbi:MAG: translation initiation factor IF-2 associated domain-containing protein, partial [Pseudomonadota bacterium]